MNIRIGSVVGDYEVLELLGAGGVGVVFKVRHKIMGRTEAIKVLLPGSAYDPAQTQRFLREVEVQASLAHPNIASVLHAFQADESLVMVMEFVEGDALDKRLARERLPLSQALDYASQALAALGYAHSRGVVHRDVKPSNMLVTPQGLLKMSDFGLAKRADDPRLTATQSTLGSLFYMSPEQVNGLATLDERTDIYSMGAVLYELTTGKRPFEQDQAFQLMLAHVESTPRAPHEADPQIPRQLSDAILKALEKAPEKRYQSAGDFRKAIATVRVALSRPQKMPVHPDPGYGDRSKSVEPVPSRVPHGNRTAVQQRAKRDETKPDRYLVATRLLAETRAKLAAWGSTWAASAGIMLVLGLWAAYSLAYRAPRPERAPEPDLSRGSITLQPPASLAVASGRHEPVRRIVSGSVVQALTLNADGSRAAVSSRAGVIEVWDAYSGDLVASRSNGGDPKALTFSPDGKLLAFASSDGRLRLWEVDANTEPVEFDSHGSAQAITFSYDNHLLAVAYPDSLGIWDVADSSRPRQAQQYPLKALALAFSPDRPILAAASSANSVELLPLDSSATSRTIDVDGGVTALSFSSDGLWLAATGRKGVKVWQQDRADALLTGFPEEFLAVAVTSLGRCIALTLGRETAQLWDITVDNQLSAFRHSQELTTAALSRNGQVAATATVAGDLWIWKAPFGWDRPGPSETLLTRVTDTPKNAVVKGHAKTVPKRQREQRSEDSKSRSLQPPLGIDSIRRPESAQPNLPAVTAGIENDPAAAPPKEPHAGTHAISETAQSTTERDEPSDQAAGEENSDRKKKNIFRKVIGLFR